MIDIDDRWLDLDFTKDPNYVFGSLPRDGRRFAGLSAADVVPLIDESQWPSIIEASNDAPMEAAVTRIFDQRQEGSCVANATAQAHQICQATQFGKQNVIQLSPISLYKRIGSSPESGAMIDDALDKIRDGGILPLNTPENVREFGDQVMPATGFYERYPRGWEATAMKFAGGEAFIVDDTRELISVLLAGFPIVVGREGHSICYVRPMYDRRGSLIVKYANSWGDWGDAGYGYDSLSQIKKSAQWAFGLRTVRSPAEYKFVI